MSPVTQGTVTRRKSGHVRSRYIFRINEISALMKHELTISTSKYYNCSKELQNEFACTKTLQKSQVVSNWTVSDTLASGI